MNRKRDRQTRDFWNRVARDWDVQVGDDGDRNRVLNSDPVLWSLIGDVAGLRVLDLGCGTGYLTRKLRQRGADVTGIDFSEAMIRIAREKSADIDFRVDSCAVLESIADGSIDIVVSNYVLMDVPDLHDTMAAIHRVLRDGGIAVLVFSHPCFPQGRATVDDSGVRYHWDFPYFDERKCTDPPWEHFQSDFIWFHRPLSAYWRAFRGAGFEVMNFDEPHLSGDRYHLADDDSEVAVNRSRPYSVAFRLRARHR